MKILHKRDEILRKHLAEKIVAKKLSHDDQAEAIFSAMTEYAQPFIKACENFVAKVDKGEAHSTRSYNEMKEALKNK